MNYGFETRCIHGNGTDEKTHSYGSVAVPIYQAATLPILVLDSLPDTTIRERDNPTRTEQSIRCRHWKVR